MLGLLNLYNLTLMNWWGLGHTFNVLSVFRFTCLVPYQKLLQFVSMFSPTPPTLFEKKKERRGGDYTMCLHVVPGCE